MNRHIFQFGIMFLASLGVCLGAPREARCQDGPIEQSPSQTAPDQQDDSSGKDPATIFPHSESSRFWISGQANFDAPHRQFPEERER